MAVRTIAVSLAGGAVSLLTAKYAIYLAKLLGAQLVAIYVVNESVIQELLKSRIFVEVEAKVYDRDLEDQGRLFLERVRKMADAKGVVCDGALLRGTVHTEVIAKTREAGADLLVMGDLKEVFSRKEIFYDEAERIFREAPCPVVIVKNYAQVDRLYKELE